MREILFRGKRLDTGEWVYWTGLGRFTVTQCGRLISGKEGLTDWAYELLTDPNTVGQYTGMTDKNGKRIFEDDIVSFKRVNALGYTTSRIGDVRYYDELPIFYIMATTGDAWDWVDCEEITVIGNIHDDQELLK